MPNTIAQNLARLQAARTAIADAITEMGGTVSTGDGYEEFPDDIRTIVSSDFEATLEVTAVAGANVTASKTGKIFTGVCNAQGVATLNIISPGTYTVQSSYSGVLSDTQSVAIMTHQQIYTATNKFITLLLTAPNGSDVTITDGTTTITDIGTGSSVTYYLPNTGTWTLSAELGDDYTEYELEVDAYGDYTKELSFQVIGIWGASWYGGESPVLTRTDGAANFDNPDPYVADGSHAGYSPFDNVMPWSGIERVTIDGNELVKIPKFWFKVTKTGDAMTFQIADHPAEGFHVSPAHADRGDGVGERDYVYCGRYHCNASYGSTTGVTPKVGITRADARTGCHAIGNNYWLSDFAMFWTTRLLYIVEMANFDSQAVIGYGRGNDSSVVVMGYTDMMPYHTGTMASNRTTYGANTQYRYMEGIWDNVADWCDGIEFSGSSVYVHNTPSEYNDSITNYTLVGTRPTSSNCIKSMFVPTVEGYEYAMYPSEVVSDNSYTRYFADGCYYDSSGVILYCGGSMYQSRSGGMFYTSGSYSASTSSSSVGARLMYLPS